jgi:tRNA pseudouridine65 synthase
MPLTRRRDDAEWVGSRSADDAQDAITDFRRLATCELPHAVDRYPTSRYALVEVSPLTGRRHQIRRHLKHIAHPIIGDATFGKGRHNRLFQELFGCQRMLLACARMQLVHPVSGQPLDMLAPLDGDFARVVDALGWQAALPATLVTRRDAGAI